MRLLTALNAILFFCFASLAVAAPVNFLYQATVPVQSESQDDWQKALPQALAQVIVKVSGNPNILNASAVRQQLTHASALVQSYSYVNNQNGASQLQVQFDPKAINAVIRGSGGELWGSQRPLTLIVLAAQTGQGQAILNNQTTNPFIAALQDNANRRGLPILLPMMDIQDMQDISLADVLNLDLNNVSKAAQRYGANGILEGRIYAQPNGQWLGDWVFSFNQQTVQWKITGDDANQVIADTVDKLANTLATQVATNENVAASFSNQHVILHIINVHGVQDFADVVKYLRGLSGVSAVEVKNVDSDTIDVDVVIAGGASALTNNLQSSSQLKLATAVANTNAVSVIDANSNNTDASNTNTTNANATTDTDSTQNGLTYQWITQNNNNSNNNAAANTTVNPTPLSPS